MTTTAHPVAHRTARAAVQRYSQAERAARPLPAHVYRRRRLVVGAFMVLLVSCVVLLAGRVGQADAGLDGPAPEAPVYVVQPGDTLWSIASDAAGSGDVRQVVYLIQERNGLRDTVLIPGQVLELP
jgi:Tfp pilus assembly protein FimV